MMRGHHSAAGERATVVAELVPDVLVSSTDMPSTAVSTAE